MRKSLIIVLFLISFFGFSQEDAWVYFTNKPNAQSFFDNPLTMLTQRALDRRSNQGISLNINDVPIEQSYIDQVDASNGIEVKAKSKWLNCVHVRGTITEINALTVFSFVDHIHFANNSLNSKNSIPKIFTIVNKQLDAQTSFNYGNSSNQIEMLNGHLLHQANYTGTGKIIALLDSGFINVNTAQPFQRLRDNNAILGGYNYVNRSTNVYDLHNHGTMTLSCIGGYKDGELVGTAPDAQFYLFVTEDVSEENPVEESYWVEAAEEADRLGVDVISTSLGYFEYDNPDYSHVYSDLTGNSAFASQGANIAFSKGMIVVASAGNSGQTSNPHISVPAEATNVLAVGAVKSDETYAAFSSIGPSFDNRIKPDVMAKGQSATLSNTAGAIVTASGTSFSCPIMAGMIASFWQAVPTLNNQQVIDFVKQSSDRFTNPNEQFGYGIPDFQFALNAALNLPQFKDYNFVIYPNPFIDTLNVELPNDIKNANLNVFNLLGQNVFSTENLNSINEFNLKNLSAGIYTYRIEAENTLYSGKLIKN